MKLDLTIRLTGESADFIIGLGENDFLEYFLAKGKFCPPRGDIIAVSFVEKEHIGPIILEEV
jgi:hypothetical protein